MKSLKKSIWSDGCAAQYKGKKTFYYLDEYSVPVERHYFGSEHGKNECDGITGQIAQRYNNSILSDVTVISNARDLKEFLCKEYENERTMIFKLIEKDDKELESIYHNFGNMKVHVLSGSCTRTLHGIKPGRKKGHLLTRAFSCFCSYCKNNDFDHCENKSFTGGNFIERRLKSDNHMSEDENLENNDEDDMIFDTTDNDKDITVEEKKPKFIDLQVQNFIVVPVKGQRDKIYYFPAQITKLENEKTIHIDYLKQDFDQPEALLEFTSEKEKNWIISIKDIIMKLPEPIEKKRGKIIFSGKINLNK